MMFCSPFTGPPQCTLQNSFRCIGFACIRLQTDRYSNFVFNFNTGSTVDRWQVSFQRGQFLSNFLCVNFFSLRSRPQSGRHLTVSIYKSPNPLILPAHTNISVPQTTKQTAKINIKTAKIPSQPRSHRPACV